MDDDDDDDDDDDYVLSYDCTRACNSPFLVSVLVDGVALG